MFSTAAFLPLDQVARTRNRHNQDDDDENKKYEKPVKLKKGEFIIKQDPKGIIVKTIGGWDENGTVL